MKKRSGAVLWSVILVLMCIVSIVFFRKEFNKTDIKNSVTDAEVYHGSLEKSLLKQNKLDNSNLSVKGNKRLSKIRKKLITNHYFGAYIGAKNENMLFSGSNGFAIAKIRVPFRRNSEFLVGKYQRFLNTAIILRFVSQRKINMSDPLEKVLPGVKYVKKLSLSDFLAQGSNLYIKKQTALALKSDDLTSTKLNHMLTKSDSGTVSADSVLEAAIIAEVTKKTYQTGFMDEAVNSLNLVETRFNRDGKAVQANTVKGYRYAEDKKKPIQKYTTIRSNIFTGSGELQMSLRDVVLSFEEICSNGYFSSKYNTAFWTSARRNLKISTNSNVVITDQDNQKLFMKYKKSNNRVLILATNFPNKSIQNKKVLNELFDLLDED